MDSGPKTMPIARALRAAAIVWVIGAALGVVLDLVQAQLWASFETGTPLTEVAERTAIVGMASMAVHVLFTIVIIVLASTWANVPGRGGVLVRVGQWTIGLVLVLQLGHMAGTTAIENEEQMQLLMYARLTTSVLWYSGLAILLAGTRAPASLRVGFVVLGAAWVGFIVFANLAEVPLEISRYVMMLPAPVIALCWAAGLWLAAPAYADVEPDPLLATDDPIRREAASGLTLLRAGFIARIVVSILAVGSLVAMRSSPSAAGSVAWLFAVLQCGLAVVIAIGLNRYAGLASDAVERGYITVVLMCIATGALLELYGAAQATELLGYAAKAQNASSMWDMPSIREIEAVQARATWLGRFASLVGLVAAVCLALTLRKTAEWLGDRVNTARASMLAVLTIAAGGSSVVLLAVAQSGALRSMAPIVGVMLVALVLAIAVLVAWLRLLGGLATRLRTQAGDEAEPGPKSW